MDANIQTLLDQIQRDGFERAETEARNLIKRASEEAEKLLRDAENEAREKTSRATREAKIIVENGKLALSQAARDIIIDIGRSIEVLIASLIREKTAEALTPTLVADLIKEVVSSFCNGGMREEQVEVLLNRDDLERVSELFFSEFSGRLQDTGVTIEADQCIESGFKLSIENGRVCFDFTSGAIAESLSRLLTPRLSEAVRDAVKPITEKR